jgi:hypothetical protein
MIRQILAQLAFRWEFLSSDRFSFELQRGDQSDKLLQTSRNASKQFLRPNPGSDDAKTFLRIGKKVLKIFFMTG